MLEFQDVIFRHAGDTSSKRGASSEPIAGLPCAYKPDRLQEFLSKLVRSNKDIRSSAKHLSNLVEISDHTHLEEFPEHEPDPCLLSYDNLRPRHRHRDIRAQPRDRPGTPLRQGLRPLHPRSHTAAPAPYSAQSSTTGLHAPTNDSCADSWDACSSPSK